MFFDKGGGVVQLPVRSSYRLVGALGALLVAPGSVWGCGGRGRGGVSSYGVAMAGVGSAGPPGSKLGLTAVIRNRPFPLSSYVAAQMYPAPPTQMEHRETLAGGLLGTGEKIDEKAGGDGFALESAFIAARKEVNNSPEKNAETTPAVTPNAPPAVGLPTIEKNRFLMEGDLDDVEILYNANPKAPHIAQISEGRRSAPIVDSSSGVNVTSPQAAITE